jgi:uncharacterized membrane protein (UPF0127 family)
VAAFFVCTGAASCKASEKEQPPLEKREFIIEQAGGGKTRIFAELARTEAERQRGLMYREFLADGEGMLFIFERDQKLSFWMKNTLIPLSIAFIDKDGRILQIRDMQPQDLTPVRSDHAVRYALEAPQGWFTWAGVAVGDIVRIDLR